MKSHLYALKKEMIAFGNLLGSRAMFRTVHGLMFNHLHSW